MFYYRWHIGDYKTATAHLSNGEDLAYRRLLDLYYETEGPITGDVAWLARRLRLERTDVVAVLDDFFEKDGDRWRHSRCDREIQQCTSLVERSKANGRLGGRKPKEPRGNLGVTQGVPTGNPVATQSGYPSTPVPQYPLPAFLPSVAKGPSTPVPLPPEKEGRKEAVAGLVENLSSSKRGL